MTFIEGLNMTWYDLTGKINRSSDENSSFFQFVKSAHDSLREQSIGLTINEDQTHSDLTRQIKNAVNRWKQYKPDEQWWIAKEKVSRREDKAVIADKVWSEVLRVRDNGTAPGGGPRWNSQDENHGATIDLSAASPAWAEILSKQNADHAWIRFVPHVDEGLRNIEQTADRDLQLAATIGLEFNRRDNPEYERALSECLITLATWRRSRRRLKHGGDWVVALSTSPLRH
jgi:hypothetical protein